MAVFNRYVNNCSRVDWEALVNGSILMYYDSAILEKDLDWLKRNCYKIVELDFEMIETVEKFHERI